MCRVVIAMFGEKVFCPFVRGPVGGDQNRLQSTNHGKEEGKNLEHQKQE